jgi:hypothetical protein
MWRTVLNNLLIKQENLIEAIHHLSQTFRLVNERLSRNDTVSNTILAVVVVMAQYVRLQGQYHQGICSSFIMLNIFNVNAAKSNLRMCYTLD